MNNKRLSFIVSIMLSMILCTPQLMAQADTSVEMADTMHSNGKIYVVVLVICILFTGILVYLFNTDKKVSKLEKEILTIKSGKNP